MVRLVSLSAYNLKCLRIDEPVKFSDGITLVTGPNESGKSTLLDAILYALFGRMTKPRTLPSAEDIVRYGASDARVRLTFQAGNATFVVRRTVSRFRASTARLHEVTSGTEKIVATTPRAVTEEIEKLLGGITFNEMLASNIVAQKDLERVLQQGPQDRKKIINVFLNLESFNEVVQKLREEQKTLEGTRQNPGLIQIERDKLKSLEGQLDELRQKVELKKSLHEKIKEVESQRSSNSENAKRVKTSLDQLELYDKLTQQLANLESESKLLESQQADLQNGLNRIQRAKADLDQYRHRVQSLAELSGIKQVIDVCVQSSQDLDERTSHLESLRADERETENEIRKIASALQMVPAEISQTSRLSRLPLISAISVAGVISGLAALALTIASLGFLLTAAGLVGVVYALWAGSRRSRFEREYREALSKRSYLEKLNRDLSAKNTAIIKLQSQAQEIESQLTKSLGQVSRYEPIFRAEISRGLKGAVSRIVETFQTEWVELNSLQETLSKLQQTVSDQDSIETKLLGIETKLEDYKKQMASITLPKLPRGLEFSRDRLSSYRSTYDELLQTIGNLDGALKIEAERLRELDTFIEVKKDLPKVVEEQRECVRGLEKRERLVNFGTLGIEGAAEALRSRVRPNVEAYMARLLRAITLDRYGPVQLDENYTLKVWDPDAGEFKPRDIFSGGTEDQFLLALRVAFALAIMPEAKGRHPEFMFLDEPLGSSDQERRAGIMELLRSELLHYFAQIFLISHVPNVEEFADHIIRLEYGQVAESSW